jgi:hypothetical protein
MINKNGIDQHMLVKLPNIAGNQNTPFFLLNEENLKTCLLYSILLYQSTFELL